MRNGKERHETLIPLRKASKLQRVARMGSAHWSTRCVTQSAAAKRSLGVPTSQFRKAWFTTPALREAGITTTELKSASFAIQDLADKDGLEMLDLGEGTLDLDEKALMKLVRKSSESSAQCTLSRRASYAHGKHAKIASL